MANPSETSRPKSVQKQTVLGAAEGQILQVQVIDSRRADRVIAVYRCGPVVQWAPTLAELFTAPREAPPWLTEGLTALPEERFIRISPPGGSNLASGFEIPPVTAADAVDFS